MYLAAAIPALLVTILIFMDQQITAVIVNRKEHKLKVGVLGVLHVCEELSCAASVLEMEEGLRQGCIYSMAQHGQEKEGSHGISTRSGSHSEENLMREDGAAQAVTVKGRKSWVCGFFCCAG